jgi:hypothetical protein
MSIISKANPFLFNKIASICEKRSLTTDPSGISRVSKETYIVGNEVEVQDTKLTLVTLNPNKAIINKTPISLSCRGYVFDNKLSIFVSIPPIFRGECHANTLSKGKNNTIKLSWVTNSNMTQKGTVNYLYTDIEYPLNQVDFRAENRGILVRLFWHYGKMFFVTNQRIREVDLNLVVSSNIEYSTDVYMLRFFKASRLVAEDLFDTTKLFSNVTYSFLYSDPVYSKATYKDTSVPGVIYTGATTSYDPIEVQEIINEKTAGYPTDGLMSDLSLNGFLDNCDTTVREPPVDKVERWRPLSFDEAQKMLKTGYTNNPVGSRDFWELTGGESLILTTPDGAYHIESSAAAWRASYSEVMLDTLESRYHKALVRSPDYMFPAGTLKKVMPQITEGKFTYTAPSKHGNSKESRIICFALACTPVEQRQLPSIIDKFNDQLQFVINHILKTATDTVVGKAGEVDIPIPESSKKGKDFRKYAEAIYLTVKSSSGSDLYKLIEAEIYKITEYPMFVYRFYRAVYTEK